MPVRDTPLDLREFLRELFGLFLIFWAIYLLLALLSYNISDPGLNVVQSGENPPANKGGLFGAYMADFLQSLFGVGALVWPLVFAFLGCAYISPRFTLLWRRWCGFFMLTLCLFAGSSAFGFAIGDLEGGGVVGNTIYLAGNRYFSPAGSALLWFFILLAGLQLAFNFSWIIACKRFWAWFGPKAKVWLSKTGDRLPLAAGFFRRCKTGLTGWLGPRLRAASRFFHSFGTQRVKITQAELEGLPGDEPLQKPLDSPVSAPAPNLSSSIQHSSNIHNNDDSLSNGSEPEFAPTRQTLPVHYIPENNPDNGSGAIFREEIRAEPDWEIADEADYTQESGDGPAIPADWRIAGDEFADYAANEAQLQLPPVDLLIPPAPQPASSEAERISKGQALMKCFEDFDIHGKLAAITPGPVVTMYEIRPDPGIRVSKIANLSDDLSLALKAVAVRIQAPIPGSDTVGIEVPNQTREMVNFRELVESDTFSHAQSPLTMILGKDITGRPYVADLAKMPHLLVAGTTGAGKSVCLNSILVSFLYRLKPKDLRLLLVDPKRVEMAVYADLPHLVHPVVTEMEDAKNALEWATEEMADRYKALAILGARNITAYNEKLQAMGNPLPEEYADLQHMPYLVIVIDEMADLMLTCAREAQSSIQRLAQLGRAAGIHMILATQRPSVDVVTGLIKANFPNRISFQVTSKPDSRTILDQSGAEYLLGKGDMLYKPSGGRLTRLHGPFISDEEVQSVAAFWKKQQKPVYDVDFSKWGAESAQGGSCGGDATVDPLYEEARDFALQHGKISISLLQRKFKIGFNRSARLIEQFEVEGIIGPADGSKPRNVIR